MGLSAMDIDYSHVIVHIIYKTNILFELQTKEKCEKKISHEIIRTG